MLIHGIHHITAISSDAQDTYNFYTRILGLRLVKKSVNQDDVETYHLFFGNKTGSPGFDLTFFPFAGVPKGVRGAGQVTVISLAVPKGALKFWKKRFEEHKVKHEEVTTRFGLERCMFYDMDDQRLELVEVSHFEKEYEDNLWVTDDVLAEHAIRRFHGARLTVPKTELIEPVLKTFGYSEETTEDGIKLYTLSTTEHAGYLEIDVMQTNHDTVNGAGTVHHIAFSVRNRDDQWKVREQIIALGLYPTHVIDRFYFASVYFRTDAGILFEIATEGPGFTADEDLETLGENLALPPFLEKHRKEIEARLKPLKQ